MRAIPVFHLQNKDVKRSLKVIWNKSELENTPHPVYLGVILDRTLKVKVTIRNNLLKEWGTNAGIIKTTLLVLYYSTAEYASPVLARSPHAHILDLDFNQTSLNF